MGPRSTAQQINTEQNKNATTRRRNQRAGVASVFVITTREFECSYPCVKLGTKIPVPYCSERSTTTTMYAIEIPLLLMFYFFSRTIVHSISTCHTKVYMNNDFVLFHVEEEELIEPAASQFCMKHLVDHTECQRIIQYHKEHCFQEQNETTTAPSSSSENEKQPNDEVIMPTQTIDYTQKKGPILQIFRVDGTLTVI